jgi:hypothetical protein
MVGNFPGPDNHLRYSLHFVLLTRIYSKSHWVALNAWKHNLAVQNICIICIKHSATFHQELRQPLPDHFYPSHYEDERGKIIRPGLSLESRLPTANCCSVPVYFQLSNVFGAIQEHYCSALINRYILHPDKIRTYRCPFTDGRREQIEKYLPHHWMWCRLVVRCFEHLILHDHAPAVATAFYSQFSSLTLPMVPILHALRAFAPQSSRFIASALLDLAFNMYLHTSFYRCYVLLFFFMTTPMRWPTVGFQIYRVHYTGRISTS